MDEAKRGGFQFSVRTLLLVTAAVALLLVPVAWVTRERQQLMRAQQEILVAREVAMRSLVREEERRRGESESPPENASPRASPNRDRDLPLEEKAPAMERVQRENADLRRQVEQLRREVQQLRNSGNPRGKPG
jgi:hypothetical protein